MCIYYASSLLGLRHQPTHVGVSSHAERGSGKASCRPPSRGRTRVAHPFFYPFVLTPISRNRKTKMGNRPTLAADFPVRSAEFSKILLFWWKNPATLPYTFVPASVMRALCDVLCHALPAS